MKDRLIRNLIFDLGGVLFQIDYDAPVRAFRSLGSPDFDHLFSQTIQRPEFDLIETGQISDEDFLNFLEEVSGVRDKDALRKAWNSILIGPWVERIRLVEELKAEGYRTFLLSNTNALHVKDFEAMMASHTGAERFREAFEAVHYSNEIGMRKPDPRVFDWVCQVNGLIPEETLFIDDSAQHIKGATSVGLRARLLSSDISLEDLLRQEKVFVRV